MKFTNRTMQIRKFAVIAACILTTAAIVGCAGSRKQETKEYLSELPVIEGGEYPSSFDLRDYGYVTAVKSQGDLGSCWAFASVAAAESSILSELKTTINDNDLDLSEHHLAWFAKWHIPAKGEDGYDASKSQAGEGFYSPDPIGSSWSSGADTYTAVLAFASGTGVATEETAPYKGKNGTVSLQDDWSLDETIRCSRLYDLEAGYFLPELKAEEDSLNENGINAVKEMLTKGKAVAIEYAYNSDEETATDTGESSYLNTKTYAHYTYEETATNHCVTIVGWDDDYAKENFNSGAQPAGNGAWIAKNSWGAVTEGTPNYGNWGIDGSGYFYISYYDKSILFPVAYDFDTSKEGGTYAVTQQYDLLNAYSFPETSSEPVKEANVFTAEKDMTLEAVGTLCSAENTTVNYEVYLMESGTEDPTDGTLAASMKKEYRYAGYYREMLDEPVQLKKGQKYAIVITECQEGDDPVYYYQHGESTQGQESIMTMLTGDYYVGIINKGESYIYFENKGWQDLSDYLAGLNGDNSGMLAEDNFCIKAFGN